MNARVEKDGEKWTLVLERELRHAPEKVWVALTDPAHLAQWAPFDADRSLAGEGTAQLSTAGTPQVSEATVKRAEAPRLLEYNWGGGDSDGSRGRGGSSETGQLAEAGGGIRAQFGVSA